MQTRLNSIDSLKGIAILLVVMGHVIAGFFEDWNMTLRENPNAMYWWRLIYSFHMSLMFFVSGYLFVSSKFNTENLGKIWLHKIQPLALPFFCMGLVNYMIRDSTTSYWFLRTLFFYITLQICYEVIRKRFKITWIADILFIVVSWKFMAFAINGRLENNERLNVIFDFQHIIWCWLYFCIGVFMRRYNLFEKVTANKCVNSAYPLVSAVYIYWCIGVGNSLSYYVNLACVCCIIVSLYIIVSKRLTEGKVARVLQYCGRHTLEIYVIHPFFLLSLPFIGDIIVSQCNEGTPISIMHGQCIEFIVSLSISIGIIALCALIYEPLKAFPLIYKCFLGREVKD